MSVTVNGGSINATTDEQSYVVIARDWAAGDLVLAGAKLRIIFEDLPGDSRRIPALYGPVALVGKFDFARRRESDVPHLDVCEAETPSLIPGLTGGLDFVLSQTSTREVVNLVPLYEIGDEFCTVYWNRRRGANGESGPVVDEMFFNPD